MCNRQAFDLPTRWLMTSLVLLVSCDPGPASDSFTAREAVAGSEIQGVACTGSVAFHENGALRTALLARTDTIAGHVLPSGSRVTFRPDSTLLWTFLAHDTLLEGILCRGEADNWMNAFHPNGRLQLAWLAGDQIVQGVPCMGATFWRDVLGGSVGVHFAPNGRLIRAKLSSDIVIQGAAFDEGDHVQFDSLGVLMRSE